MIAPTESHESAGHEPAEQPATHHIPGSNVGALCEEAVCLFRKLTDRLSQLTPHLRRQPTNDGGHLVEVRGPAGFRFVQGPMSPIEAADFCREFASEAKGTKYHASEGPPHRMIGRKRKKRRWPEQREQRHGRMTPATHPAVVCRPPAEQPKLFLRQALDLWSAGQELPAVMVARLAIESYLYALCLQHPRIDARTMHRSAVTYQVRLMHVGAIDKKNMKRIDHMYNVASQVAHARAVSYHRMAYVIHATRAIIELSCFSNGEGRAA